MPHLSPMNWFLAPTLYLLISLPLLISMLWWSQTPIFPSISFSTSNKTFSSWSWS